MTAFNQPAIFAGIRSRVDGSYTLTLVTQELDGKTAAPLLDMQNKLCDVSIALEGHQDEIAPEYQKTNPARSKSPSKALRDELWAYWKATVHDEDFDTFYETYIFEKVRQIHDRRMAL